MSFPSQHSRNPSGFHDLSSFFFFLIFKKYLFMSLCWVLVVTWEIFVTACGFSPVWAGGLSYSVACGIPLPQRGTKLASPALGGGFSTVEPSGKSLTTFL